MLLNVILDVSVSSSNGQLKFGMNREAHAISTSHVTTASIICVAILQFQKSTFVNFSV